MLRAQEASVVHVLELRLSAAHGSLNRVLDLLARKMAVIERVVFEAGDDFHTLTLGLRVPADRWLHLRSCIDREVVTFDVREVKS